MQRITDGRAVPLVRRTPRRDRWHQCAIYPNPGARSVLVALLCHDPDTETRSRKKCPRYVAMPARFWDDTSVKLILVIRTKSTGHSCFDTSLCHERTSGTKPLGHPHCLLGRWQVGTHS